MLVGLNELVRSETRVSIGQPEPLDPYDLGLIDGASARQSGAGPYTIEFFENHRPVEMAEGAARLVEERQDESEIDEYERGWAEGYLRAAEPAWRVVVYSPDSVEELDVFVTREEAEEAGRDWVIAAEIEGFYHHLPSNVAISDLSPEAVAEEWEDYLAWNHYRYHVARVIEYDPPSRFEEYPPTPADSPRVIDVGFQTEPRSTRRLPPVPEEIGVDPPPRGQHRAYTHPAPQRWPAGREAEEEMDYMSPDELEEELNLLRQEAQEIDRQLAEEDDESNLSGLKEKKNMKASQVKELKAELKQANKRLTYVHLGNTSRKDRRKRHDRDWSESTKPHERNVYTYELKAMNISETDQEIARNAMIRLSKDQMVDALNQMIDSGKGQTGSITEKQKETLRDMIKRIGG